VYTPNRRIFYLNITINNIVKVFRFDISPSSDDLLRASFPVITLTQTLVYNELLFITDKSSNVYSNKIVLDF